MYFTWDALDFSTSFPHNRPMTDFLLGAAAVLFVAGAASSARIVLGMLRDTRRMALEALEAAQAAGKRGGTSAGLVDAASRIAALERKVAEIDLSVLDTAEKVAARLSDRERKRTTRAAQPEEEALDDEAGWWARARAAHPLPGMPTDTAQLPLLPVEDDA